MAIRSKIARLPNDIREQLNLRLLEGETGRELTAWLNALPEVQSILASQFNGSPISEVNLTLWRQGGYLQWLTERECFGSARALAEGDCHLADAGLSAERLLNVLTIRYGELLMRWDFTSDENVSGNEAFSEVARKARVLQGISRSVLAIHRIQSQKSRQQAAAAPSASASASHSPLPSLRPAPATAANSVPGLAKAVADGIRRSQGRAAARPEILSGPIAPSSVPLKVSHTPFKPDLDLDEILKAV